MIDAGIQNELLQQVDRLPIDRQREVLAFVSNLVKSSATVKPPRHFLELAGTLPAEDAREMLQAIEEGCEQVDANGW
jgi:hypothetical protein